MAAASLFIKRNNNNNNSSDSDKNNNNREGEGERTRGRGRNNTKEAVKVKGASGSSQRGVWGVGCDEENDKSAARNRQMQNTVGTATDN